MKRKIQWAALALVPFCFVACSKTTPSPTPPDNHQPKTVGNTTTYPNGYVVKTIGFSRIILGVDDNYKLIAAEFYGGGNRVIVKPGAGNVIGIAGGSYSPLPSGFAPDGLAPVTDAAIDNGVQLDTVGGTVVRISGFDRSKVGYNQLNLVMTKLVRATPPGTAGFFDNIAYFAYNYHKPNTEYTNSIFPALFSGNVSVTDVEIAAPAKDHPYIVEDEIVTEGTASYSYQQGKAYALKMQSSTFQLNFSPTAAYNFSFGGSLNYQWVNAGTGTVTKTDNYDFTLAFPNIKSYNEVVEPSDTTNKVFLRITGFDPSVTGFNALRLFIARDQFNTLNGGLPFITVEATSVAPSLANALKAYTPTGLYCDYAAPLVPHY